MKSSSIPYGYRIVRGKAVIEEREAKKVRDLYSFYLSGMSISNSKDMAGINVCVRTANDMLQRETYTGDDYYPAIIDRATFDAAMEERAKRVENRSLHKPTTPKDAVGFKTRFRVTEDVRSGTAAQAVETKVMTPAQKVGFLYSLIVADENGTETITAADRSKLHNLVG